MERSGSFMSHESLLSGGSEVMDLLNSFDWVCWLVAWGCRAKAVVVMWSTLGAGFVLAGTLMLVADICDLLAGYVKMVIGSQFVLIPLDRIWAVINMSPAFMHIGCFQNPQHPDQAIVDKAESATALDVLWKLFAAIPYQFRILVEGVFDRIRYYAVGAWKRWWRGRS